MSSQDLPINMPGSSSSRGGGSGGAAGPLEALGNGGRRNGAAPPSSLSQHEGRMVEGMLQRLQSLAWRRVDVSFSGATMPLAHNHIQVCMLCVRGMRGRI
jgi:hypothetical protein